MMGRKIVDIWKCSRSCTACVWFSKGGVCGKWECEEHNRKPQTTRALTCRWYSKRITGGSRQEEETEEHSESEARADRFWDDWEATTKETMRLLREIAED